MTSYQEFKTATWRHILDGPHASGPQHGVDAAKIHKAAAKEVKDLKDHKDDLSSALVAAVVRKQAKDDVQKTSGGGEFQIIVDSLATVTGSDPSEFTDATLVADIGVDSIVAIEVVSAVKELGVDLPAAFVFDYPTISDLRRESGGQDTAAPENDMLVEDSSSEDEDENAVSPTPDADDDFSPAIALPELVTSSASHVEKEPATPAPEVESDDKNDTSPQPSIRMTILQGRPNKVKTPPLYMMSDGTGTVASFIHLRPFKLKQAVYGVDSPYFRCPSRMTSKVGIEGVAKLVVDALIKAHLTGPFLIGGYLGRLPRGVGGLAATGPGRSFRRRPPVCGHVLPPYPKD